MILKGVDVAAHQAPSAINWKALAREHSFLIARATYGTKPDRHFREHVKRAREVGMVVGAYHFFRQTQPARLQAEAFAEAVDAVGYGAGFLPPALDLEANELWDGAPSRDGYKPALDIARTWQTDYGAFAVYTTALFAKSHGECWWWSAGLLWIAHWGVQSPQTPEGVEWHFWQHKVSPLPGIYPRSIDQNIFNGTELPVLVSRE